MADELESQVDSSVTETDASLTAPVESTPDLSSGAETVTETAGASAQPEWRGVRDILPDYGFANDQFEDDAAALKHLAEQARQYQQIAPYYQQIAPHWSAFQQWQAQQNQAQQQPAKPAEPPKSYWDKPPEWDPAWTNLVQRNEQGQLVAVPGAQPDLPQKVMAYAKWKEQQLGKLLQDPVEATWGGIEQKLNTILEQRDQQLAARIYAKYQGEQYLRDNAQYLLQLDQNGQPLQDPTTGGPAMTPYGQALAFYANEATQAGLAPQLRKNYAESMARAWVMQQQPAQAPVQQQAANEQHKQAFVGGGAKRIPNRGGTVNVAAGSDTVSQNGSHDLRDMLYGSFRKAGLIDATAT